MATLLDVLAQWDRGEAVESLRLTLGGPAVEQSAHLLAFELLRDSTGLVLPPDGDAAAWLTWGAEAVKRVSSWPRVQLSAQSIDTAKRFSHAVLRSTWDGLLASADPTNRVLVSQSLPATPREMGELDRLTAYLLVEYPHEPGSVGHSESAVDVAVRLLAAAKAAKAAPVLKAFAVPMETTHGSDGVKVSDGVKLTASELGPTTWVRALQDLEQRIDEALASLKEHGEAEMEVVRDQLEELTSRLSGVESGGRAGGTGDAPAVEVRRVTPGPTASVGPGAGLTARAAAPPPSGTPGPVVVEGRRPLEHGLRGDATRPDAEVIGT